MATEACLVLVLQKREIARYRRQNIPNADLRRRCSSFARNGGKGKPRRDASLSLRSPSPPPLLHTRLHQTKQPTISSFLFFASFLPSSSPSTATHARYLAHPIRPADPPEPANLRPALLQIPGSPLVPARRATLSTPSPTAAAGPLRVHALGLNLLQSPWRLRQTFHRSSTPLYFYMSFTRHQIF